MEIPWTIDENHGTIYEIWVTKNVHDEREYAYSIWGSKWEIN
jgi:hypothetical protein